MSKADEIKKLIAKVPQDKRMDAVQKAMDCKDFAEGVELAKKYGVDITEKQLKDYADWAMNEMTDAELEDIVKSVVPFFLVSTAVSAVKTALGKK